MENISPLVIIRRQNPLEIKQKGIGDKVFACRPARRIRELFLIFRKITQTKSANLAFRIVLEQSNFFQYMLLNLREQGQLHCFQKIPSSCVAFLLAGISSCHHVSRLDPNCKGVWELALLAVQLQVVFPEFLIQHLCSRAQESASPSV